MATVNLKPIGDTMFKITNFFYHHIGSIAITYSLWIGAVVYILLLSTAYRV